MARKWDTGAPTEYTEPETRELTEALENAGGAEGIRGSFRIEADIEWNGSSRGNRSVTFRNVDLTGVADALRGGKGERIGTRLASYGAVGWAAQLRQLMSTRAGQQYLAGELNVSTRTRQRWAAGSAQPSPANRAAIARAYGERATDRTSLRRAGYVDPGRVADALTAALRNTGESPGEVRFRNIRSLTFGSDT